MNDREKVIRGLEHCSDPFMCDGNCPYYTAGDEISECTCYLAGDAMELLKAQSVKPRRDGRVWRCGNCGGYVGFEDHDENDPNEFDNYCRKCGKAVAWGD